MGSPRTQQLWFLSMLGSQQSVRALLARPMKGETTYLSEDDLGGGSPCWLVREAWGTWRFRGARLPSTAAYHGMLVPDLAAYTCERQDVLLLARAEEEAPVLHSEVSLAVDVDLDNQPEEVSMRTEQWFRERPIRAERVINSDRTAGHLSIGTIWSALGELSDDPPTEEDVRLLAPVIGCLDVGEYLHLSRPSFSCCDALRLPR